MRTLSRFEPFRGASTLQDQINRLFNDVFERPGDESNLTSWAPAVDIFETEHELVVKADLDFMKQAILNVVINGIQAMSEGGQLTISAQRDDVMVVVEIRDTGGGIPKEVQEKIFELYFTTKADGSGIGLAQTYQVMQWHYGTVDFETAEGQGTTFRLRMPLAESGLGAVREVAIRTQ